MKASILCVDDEKDITEAVRLNLLNEDYELVTFNDPKEGLEAAKSREYTVALVDIRMPGMTGIEFMSALKEISPRTVKINMSSHADLEVVLEALGKNHVYDFIKKPFKREKFLAVIRKAVRLFNLERERDELSESLKEKNALLEDWNKRLDEEVQHKTLELSIRDRLMQNLSGCSHDHENPYDLIKEFFSSFIRESEISLYINKKESYELHQSFISEEWVREFSQADSPKSGQLDQSQVAKFNKSEKIALYIEALERNDRTLGFIFISRESALSQQEIEIVQRFIALVSLVVYDELASERMSEISLTALLEEE